MCHVAQLSAQNLFFEGKHYIIIVHGFPLTQAMVTGNLLTSESSKYIHVAHTKHVSARDINQNEMT